MDNKKQSAVQRIIERAKNYPSKEIRDYILRIIIQEEESKAMEKEQIKDAYEAEQNNCRGIFKYENFEHYYKETYGQ